TGQATTRENRFSIDVQRDARNFDWGAGISCRTQDPAPIRIFSKDGCLHETRFPDCHRHLSCDLLRRGNRHTYCDVLACAFAVAYHLLSPALRDFGYAFEQGFETLA